MFLSVIVPVYNVEKYLRECLESILNQTFTDFEVILVDDGSKDSSGAICDEYAEKDSRVKVIHKENGGQSTARNTGFREARGKYTFFIDSDDFVTYNGFFADVNLATQHNTDIVLYRYKKYYSSENTKSVGVPFSKMDYSNNLELLSELVKNDTFFCSCWTKVIRTSLLRDNNIMFDESLSCEDMDWYYNVLQYADGFKVLDKECINYRQRENSVTSVFKKKSITDYIFTIEKWYDNISNIEDTENRYVLFSSLAKLYCNLLIAYSINKDKLKEEKNKIFSFKHLLKYNLNSRTNKFFKLSKLMGLNLTCTLINILDKVR